MTDPRRPPDAQLKAEVAEFQRFAETEIAPMLLADRLPLSRFMGLITRWGIDVSKARSESDQGLSTAPGLPTPEQIQRWEAEVGAFFEALRAEFPDTYRDPAFKGAVLAGIPVLVKPLLSPAS